ncbi:MAG: hypothetical protein FWG72_00815 [Oscillospiraceae bacterium]|nr:hypothetical protein [Oscillospiraceae bacterium]
MLILPDDVRTLMTALAERGHSVYAVGGCVRDSLLGRVPGDWDIATSARPRELLSIIGGEATGGKYGTVTARGVQVTPFRRESGYSDHRRPDKVEFVSDLETDLARRDFTVNALCADIDGGIVDLVGGRDDLGQKIIRCIGDPFTRFEEDALRILRALRFCAVLGFTMEERTRAALMAHMDTLQFLSKKVILHELVSALNAMQ